MKGDEPMKTLVFALGILMVTGISMDLIAEEKVIAAEIEKAVAQDTVSEEEAKDTYKPVEWAPAVKPKALSNNVLKGIKWLLDHQDPEGSWSQGEESRHMGTSKNNLKDKPNVADTCAAALALIRSGSTPSKGEYARNITKAVTYVCDQIKKSDDKSLFITDIKGTRLQMKLGTYIDTFMASMLLAEVTGKMPDTESEKMAAEAFEKVMDKIERNQKADGSFGGTGWANSLSQSMAAKGFNRGVQAGASSNETVRARFEMNAEKQYDTRTN